MTITSTSNLIDSLRNSVAFSDNQSISEDLSMEKIKDNTIVNEIGGQVEIQELSLIVKGGQRINLLEVYAGIVVEENLFSTGIAGAVSVIDSVGGLEKFMLRGGESLIVKISKPNNGGILIWREDLVVIKIGAGNYESRVGSTTYNLHFASRSFIRSQKKNLFRSYKNQPIANAVVDLYKLMSVNDLFIEDPKLTLQKPFICTGISPNRAIDRLAQRACSKDKFFVFFERFVPIYGTYPDNQPFSTSHYFGSVEKLIEDSISNPIKTIVYTQKLEANKEPNFIRGINLKRRANFNHIPAMQYGLYNTTISTIDPITRTVSNEKLSYTDIGKSTKDFYENKLIDDTNIFANYDDLNYETPGRKVILSSINESVPRENWIKNNIFGQLTKTYFQIYVDIEGGTNQIAVGHVVNFILPSLAEKSLNPNRNYGTFDLMYSGKYLVTGVNHAIKAGKYIKSLQLSRSSSPVDMNLDSIDYRNLDEFSLTEQEIYELFGNRRTPL